MRRVRRHRRAGGGRPQGELEAEGTNRAGRLSISRPSSIAPFQIERVQGDEEKHAKLEAEVEQLTWKLRKMEESRRVYEDATSQLGSFLELVSSQLTVSGRWFA